MIEIRRPGDTEARREIVITGARQGLWDTWIARNQQARQSPGIERRLRAGHPSLSLPIFLPKGHDYIPPKTDIDGEVVACMPAVLCVGSKVAIAQIKWRAGRLREIAGHTDEKVRVRIAGFCAIDVESSVEGCVGVLVHLVDVELRAKLQGM